MSLAIVLLLQIISAIATIVLFSAGLAVIFGMMRVINLAHGEFLMVGAYAAVKSTAAGINIWVSMVIIAPIVTTMLGLVVEYLLIRRLYGRLIDTLLATWGLSLFLMGLVTMLYGNTTSGIPMPLGTITIGSFGLGAYSLVIIASAAIVVLTILLILKLTPYGILARGTMQNADMVAALGYNPKHVYAATFAAGAALSGLAGGLLAPVNGIVPTMGAAFVAKAFITVISGGVAIIMGTGSAAVLLGTVNQVVSYFSTPVIGEAALLLVAILILRALPNGISGRFFKGGV
jgi:urea transport system permease protein